MNKYTFSFSVVWILTVQAAYSQTRGDERKASDKMQVAQNVPTLRIDPAKAYGGTVSDYFSDFEYIPLETTPESLFGYISELLITDSSFVILDPDTRSVLFFELTGKFISRVTASGNYRPDGILYNKADKEIIITSHASADKVKGVRYNLRGTYISELEAIKKAVTKEQKEMVMKLSAIYLANGYLANMNRFDTGDSLQKNPFYYWNISQDGVLYKSLVPRNINTNISSLTLSRFVPMSRILSSDEPDHFFFSTPFENLVYKITKDTAVKLFRFVFPAANQVSSRLLNSNSREYIDSTVKAGKWYGDNTIFGIGNINLVNNNVFFQTITVSKFMFDSNGNQINRNFVYNLKNNRLSAFERLVPDSSSFYLPFRESRWSAPVISSGYYYTTLSSLVMFTEMKKTKSRNPHYTPALEEYFKTQSRKSNPVIVRMKIKT